ncbi:MAG: hypothetical protein WA885_15905 [Phormidesmis sp.]
MTMQLTVDQITQIGDLAGSSSKLNNFISSINAYADMSPDLSIRKEVNDWMMRRDRQALSCTDWCHLFSHQPQAQAVLAFIYEQFAQYSGLDFRRVRPDDSLNSHLHFPLVCWFDWSITFCEDFFQAFEVDLSDRFDESDFITLGEMATFLMEQVASQAS